MTTFSHVGMRPGSVLVTGASGGIGGAISRVFAAAGWCVWVHYRKDKASAESVLDWIQRAGGRGTLYEADVRNAQSVEQMVGFYLLESADEADLHDVVRSFAEGGDHVELRRMAVG